MCTTARPAFALRTGETAESGEAGFQINRRQQCVYHVELSRFPADFPERIENFLEAAGLS